MDYKKYFISAILCLVIAFGAYKFVAKRGFTEITQLNTISVLGDKYTVESFIKNRLFDPVYAVVKINGLSVFMRENALSISVSFNESDSTLTVKTTGEYKDEFDTTKKSRYLDIKLKYLP